MSDFSLERGSTSESKVGPELGFASGTMLAKSPPIPRSIVGNKKLALLKD